MKSGSAYIYVLTALGEGPSHGLGIAEDVANFTGGQVLLGPGTLYRCLRDLSKDGLVERTEVEDGGESSHRKYYRITDLGRVRLAREVGNLDRLVRAAKGRLGELEPVRSS